MPLSRATCVRAPRLRPLLARVRRQNISPQVITRIARELKELTKAPPEGIKHRPTDEDSLAEIHAEIEGPGARKARACLHA